MMRVKFTATGPLHENPDSHLRRAVSDALDETARYAKGLVQDRTPVRTGRLKQGWSVRKSRWSEYSLGNNVPYAPYVERRVGMYSRSKPEIERHMAKSMGGRIKEELS